MSSASDQTVFSESVEPQNNANLFEQKKWAYITDSNSPNGSFGSQLQFDLSLFQSMNFWFDLSQTVITFPIKLSIANVDAFAPAAAPGILAATIKAGFHHFIDQVQVNIGTSSLQNATPFVNIDATYKILTEWNKDTLTKWGPTLGVALDDIISSTDGATTVSESVDNLPLVTATNGVGFTPWNTKNPGIKERLVVVLACLCEYGVADCLHIRIFACDVIKRHNHMTVERAAQVCAILTNNRRSANLHERKLPHIIQYRFDLVVFN